ncbi:hypothetical protein JCM21900_000804 [Sporobolomyces salmonicolor]
MSAQTPVCFDVLGTCFSFEATRHALRKVFPQLEELHAQSIVEDWFHSAQRDFTCELSHLSMNGQYTPIAKVLKATLPRIYLMSGLVPPSAASPSSSSTTFSPSLIDPVVASIPSMPARPGLGACAALLQMHNFRVMAATNGGLETTRGLFENALGKEEAGKWEYFSCDEDRVAKPSPSVYEDVWKKLGLGGVERKGWFVASHTWDLFAAKKAGFKTAFVTYEEHLVLPELFGQPDIVATDLEDAARQIIAAEAA